MRPLTREFSFTRAELAWIGAREYLASFWWFAMVIPIFGLGMVIWGYGPLQMVGVAALLWPITIPGRAFLTATRADRAITQGVDVALAGSDLLFRRPEGGGMRVPPETVRDVIERGGIYLLRLRRLGVLPVPANAFLDEEARTAFEAWRQTVGARAEAEEDPPAALG
jgi:hypothetical protein